MSKKKDDEITWSNDKRKLSDLKFHRNNPRKLSAHAKKELLKSFKKYGYAETVAINLDNTLVAGHQRVHIMSELGWFEKEIDVRIPSRMLNEDEAKEYLIRSNLNVGDWDFDLLATQFDSEALLTYGFEKEFLLKGFETEENPVEGGDPSTTSKKKKQCPNCGCEL